MVLAERESQILCYVNICLAHDGEPYHVDVAERVQVPLLQGHHIIPQSNFHVFRSHRFPSQITSLVILPLLYTSKRKLLPESTHWDISSMYRPRSNYTVL